MIARHTTRAGRFAGLRQDDDALDIPRPVLKGKKALVIGVANDSSIAYGCAKAFRELGADVAITYLNDKAKPHVEPLARASWRASLFLPLDVAVRAPSSVCSRSCGEVGQARHPRALDRVRPKGGPAGRAPQLLGGRVREGDGRPATRSCAWRSSPRR
jgi:hypothetical protein